MRKKLDIDAPSRTSTLHAINEAKKHENALADMAYGEKKIRDESLPASASSDYNQRCKMD
jgi:hypothetical protein